MTVVHTFIVLQASAVWTDSAAVASHLVDVIPPFFLHTHFSPARITLASVILGFS